MENVIDVTRFTLACPLGLDNAPSGYYVCNGNY